MFSQRTDLSESMLEHYAGIDKWGWDPFLASKLSNGRPLHFAMVESGIRNFEILIFLFFKESKNDFIYRHLNPVLAVA